MEVQVGPIRRLLGFVGARWTLARRRNTLEPRREVVDLIEVEHTGCQNYVTHRISSLVIGHLVMHAWAVARAQIDTWRRYLPHLRASQV